MRTPAATSVIASMGVPNSSAAISRSFANASAQARWIARPTSTVVRLAPVVRS
jgi:hypothetical protein